MKTFSEWQDLAKALSPRTQAFIDGKFVDAIDGEQFDVVNPATEQVIAQVASCDHKDIDVAVSAARRSFESGVWSRQSPSDRKKVMLKFAALVESHREELGLTDTLDMGKPISDSMGFDVSSTIDLIQWTAESIDKIYDEIAPTPDNAIALIRREPAGVVGAIVPWNYPLMMAVWKVAPALAAGNSMVLKPSEKSPLSALRLAELACEAGIPDGVLNVVSGFGHTAGKALALHMDVDVLAFTGSTNVGKQLMQYAGQSNMKQVWLETGGKSPNIVFSDCEDIEATAAMAAVGIFDNQGETCIATSRLFIENTIKDEFIGLLKREAGNFIPGDPLDPATKMGPLVDKQHYQHVCDYIEHGKEDGAALIHGGLSAEMPSSGYFISPTIFDETTAEMRIVSDEIFGPVLAVDTFSSWQEAVSKANNTPYGLGASVWTSNLGKAHQTANAINSGMVWVNDWGAGSAATPFGGVKASGYGRDKSLHSIDKYTNLKTIWINLRSQV